MTALYRRKFSALALSHIIYEPQPSTSVDGVDHVEADLNIRPNYFIHWHVCLTRFSRIISAKSKTSRLLQAMTSQYSVNSIKILPLSETNGFKYLEYSWHETPADTMESTKL